MKKIFTIFLAFVATTALWAEDFEVDGIYYDIKSSTEAEVTHRGPYSDSYSNEYSGVVIIPSTVTNNSNTYRVTSIGEEAFYKCTELTSVIIGDNVTSIGNYAFHRCSSLESIVIPNNVKSIGKSAFKETGIYNNESNWENGSLYTSDCLVEAEKISGAYTIKEGTKLIADYVFTDCTGLTSITIPSSLTNIGKGVFEDCSSLTSVVWNAKKCEDPSSQSFYDVRSQITSFTLGDSVEYIPLRLCCEMNNLTSIVIPNSVTSIGRYAFYDCKKITSITIPDNVKNIGEYTFTSCTGLTSIIIPNSVTSIGDAAFYNCTGLTSITIPNSVTEVGRSAFEGCSGLTSVTIGNGVTSIDAAFNNCSSLTSVVWNVKNCDISYLNGRPFADCLQITSFIFGDSVQSIPAYLCDGMNNLTSITIPNSVTSIGRYAFEGCSGLKSIESLAEVPPTLRTDAFYKVSTKIPVYVPCGTVSAYKSVYNWRSFTNIQEPLAEYSIATNVNDDKMGTAKVNKNSICGNQISAIPNYGYHFVRWSDGNTDNPRTLVLTQDTTLTAEFAISQYSITTAASHSTRGTTYGDTTLNYLEYATISATANYGYHFTKWDDGNKDNPRIVQVTADKTYTAYFENNTYIITKKYDSQQGSISGPTSGKYLSEITLTATPKTGYHFVQWGDGNTDNPRSIVLTQDTTFTAEFAQSYSGQCGDNLYWAYDEASKTIAITGSGDMYDYTKDTQPWLLFQDQITEVTTSNTTTSIGKNAFAGCVRLSKVSLGIGVENIAANAFAECNRLYDIYCYASYPPFADESSFANYNVYVYIPCENQRDYILDVVWGKFKFIECIGAESEEMEGDDVTITPGSTDVTITWPTEDDADTYTIIIMKDGEVFCTLTFNSNGQLLSIAFAPGRQGNHPARYAEQTANGGYRFTVTSLEEDTKYGYNLDVKDASSNTIKSYEGEFTTKSDTTTDIDNVTSTTDVQKLLRDGQIIILRDGVEYNALGQTINK